MIAAVLFARSNSIYKNIEGLDVYDIERDARSFSGNLPIIAHPPCRAWGRLRHLAKPRFDEMDLARFAVSYIYKNGGILEHPAHSTLWKDQNLPLPGSNDEFGGWTLPIKQHCFGHRAEKNTWLYINGIQPKQLPIMPLVLGEASHVISSSKRGSYGSRPEVSRAEREETPLELALWLVKSVQLIGEHRKITAFGGVK